MWESESESAAWERAVDWEILKAESSECMLGTHLVCLLVELMVVGWVDSLVVSLETELGVMLADVWGIE